MKNRAPMLKRMAAPGGMTLLNLLKGSLPGITAFKRFMSMHEQHTVSVRPRSGSTSGSDNHDSDGDDDESSSESGDSTLSEDCNSKELELSLQRIQSLHASDSGPPQKSSYAESGMSKSRCKRALKNPPCKCKCSMPLRILLSICQAFWHLSKPSQDSLLWSIQLEAGSSRKRWSLGGFHLCRQSWLYFLGVGKQRVSRCKRKFHGRDLRTIGGGPCNSQSQ